MSDLYIFIIDTDAYAGNFLNDLCAYITGKYPENSEYLEDLADQYRKDMKINYELDDYNEHIIYEYGEYGETCCDIYPTPGHPSMNSVGIFMDRKPTQEEIDVMMDRAVKFFTKH